MNNTILNGLTPEEKNKPFVTIFKDGATFDIKLSDLISTYVATATGTNVATLNAKNGIVTFTDPCEIAPSWIEYTIYNSLITASSLVAVNVQSSAEGHASLVSVVCASGTIAISINDGFTSLPAAPTVIFEILN